VFQFLHKCSKFLHVHILEAPVCAISSLYAAKTFLLTVIFDLQLVAAEGRISRVEECDCQKSCRVNGSVHPDGATWQRGCDICACVVRL
jgi:hypothetical protein